MPKRTFFRLDEDKRERVIRKAIDEFRVNGFENAKVSAIAQNAGIANGSVYQYFEDKRELFLYCVNWTVENFIREADRQMPLAGLNIFDYFQTGLRERMAFWKQEPELALFSNELTNGNIDFPHGETNPIREARGAHVPRLAGNGVKWGALRDDVDEAALSAFLTAIVCEAEDRVFKIAAASGFNPNEEQSRQIDDYIEITVEFIKNGLAPKPKE